MIRTVRDMTDAEIDEHAAMRDVVHRIYARTLWECAGLISAGAVIAAIMFSNTAMPVLALVGGIVLAVILFTVGVFRLLTNVGPHRFETMQQSRASMRLKRPQVEAFTFRIHRAWYVSTVDEDCDAILIETGTDSWIYANGLLELCDAIPDDENRIPSDWSVERIVGDRIVSSKALPPLVTIAWMPEGPEELPATITRADWTLVVLTYLELPEQWRAGIERENASVQTH